MNECDDYEYDDGSEELSKQLGVSKKCASDVLYLRGRNRWSQELEDQLIADHRAGKTIRIMEYGVTKETQDQLLMIALRGRQS